MPLPNPTLSASSTPGSKPRRGLGLPFILLLVSVAINYIDRGNLSIAAPLLQGKMFSVLQLGTLLSAFFWSYAAFQFASGWIVDRFDVNRVLIVGFLFWSLATAATGWATGFGSLLCFRLLVGAGESVAYPAYSKIFSRHLDEKQRGMANALIDCGTKVGPILGTLLGGLLVAHYGWRPLFWILGFGALLWVPCWIRWMPGKADGVPETAIIGPVPGYWDIVRRRDAWATCLGLFCANYLWYFLLTWLPTYLFNERHFTMTKVAWLGALPFLLTASATAIAGLVSYRAIARGASTTRVRKTCTGAGLAVTTVIAAVPAVSNVTAAMAILLVACVGYGVYTSSHWAITQTLAGPPAVGKWTGLMNFWGNVPGIIAPQVTGWIVYRTGHFFWAFVVIACVTLAGSLNYIFLLGPVETVDWEKELSRK
ncbi:MAG TPA: MFS transporter [Opitutaceae bacterium]|nr:MFS transporter [Opitutaceae bacterium]